MGSSTVPACLLRNPDSLLFFTCIHREHVAFNFFGCLDIQLSISWSTVCFDFSSTGIFGVCKHSFIVVVTWWWLDLWASKLQKVVYHLSLSFGTKAKPSMEIIEAIVAFNLQLQQNLRENCSRSRRPRAQRWVKRVIYNLAFEMLTTFI